MLPLTYAIRNLFRSPGRLVQLVAGSGLVVLLVMCAGAINGGMKSVLAGTGSPRNVILLGAGSEESVERSEVPPVADGIVSAAVRGLATALDRPAVSPEIHHNGLVALAGNEDRQALLRGVTETAFLVHPEVRVVEGGFPGPGQVMVGRLAHRRLRVPPESLATGRSITVAGTELRISGMFEAPGTVMEAEIWVELNQLKPLIQRENLSCVVVRLEDAEFDDVDLFAKQRLDLEMVAVRETDYYGRVAAFYRPLRFMTWLTAGLIAAGAVFGGLNTLFAAFASRIAEMGTLQAIGFRRRALALSLLGESLLATLTGTLLASVVAILALDGIAVPFSIGTFTMQFTPGILVLGLASGVLLGILGTVPPAWSCLRPPIPAALRSA